MLVGECAISSVEIASDLANLGAARVVVTNRTQRYGLPKLVRGVPLDHIAFTRFSALSKEWFPMAAVGAGFKQFVLSVAGNRMMRFVDGSAEEFDGIVFGTGYHLDLPFLSDDLHRTLDVDAHHIDLYNFTFHSELPGLAFAGLYEQIGPYYPVLELQARWIAYAMSGAVAAPSKGSSKRVSQAIVRVAALRRLCLLTPWQHCLPGRLE